MVSSLSRSGLGTSFTWEKPSGLPVETTSKIEGIFPVVLFEYGLLLLDDGVEEHLDLRPDGGQLVDEEDAPVRPENARPRERQGVFRAHALRDGLDVLQSQELRLVRIFVALDPGETVRAAYPFDAEFGHRVRGSPCTGGTCAPSAIWGRRCRDSPCRRGTGPRSLLMDRARRVLPVPSSETR